MCHDNIVSALGKVCPSPPTSTLHHVLLTVIVLHAAQLSCSNKPEGLLCRVFFVTQNNVAKNR